MLAAARGTMESPATALRHREMELEVVQTVGWDQSEWRVAKIVGVRQKGTLLSWLAKLSGSFSKWLTMLANFANDPTKQRGSIRQTDPYPFSCLNADK